MINVYENSDIFLPPTNDNNSAWKGHIPFARYITKAFRPEVFVELGTYYGVSYSAFWDSAIRHKIPMEGYAVDMWEEGYDETTPGSNQVVFEKFKSFHDENLPSSSHILKMEFEQALEKFSDESIDLLHIDGNHNYEIVKKDFFSWLPKMKKTGMILLHDVHINWDGYGVHVFWDEIKNSYPSFSFHHSYGLGLLCVSDDIPENLAWIFTLQDPEKSTFIDLFTNIGLLFDKYENCPREKEYKETIKSINVSNQEKTNALQEFTEKNKQLNLNILETTARNKQLEQKIQDTLTKNQQLNQRIMEVSEKNKSLKDDLQSARDKLQTQKASLQKKDKSLEEKTKLIEEKNREIREALKEINDLKSE
jgi:hypothetical protein